MKVPYKGIKKIRILRTFGKNVFSAKYLGFKLSAIT